MTILDALSGVPNVSQPLPWLVTAGQPGVAQLTAARDAGVKAVIDIRDPMERRPFDEAGTIQSLGMEYINLPVTSGALSDELMERILTALRAHADTPVIYHCASANRVGGPLIAYLILDRGMNEQEAVDVAMQGGLRSAEMLEWGLEYARAKAPGDGLTDLSS